MAKTENGDTNIEEKERTFAGFVKIVSWSCVVIICVLIFLAVVDG